ncbi:cupin domain-containing protein [Pseudonocardiaceae bacterium YIM PH 21723]|nr:cupin domain-containing protein [Pseudonocardiaceae bacterium YIM PH 21723]
MDLLQAFEGIGTWSPHIVATVNDTDVKIVELDGEFVWHSHPETDELFLVLSGSLTLELAGREPVVLGPMQLFTVPRSVEHRPVAAPGTRVILIEAGGTVNTGDAQDPRFRPTTGTPL